MAQGTKRSLSISGLIKLPRRLIEIVASSSLEVVKGTMKKVNKCTKSEDALPNSQEIIKERSSKTEKCAQHKLLRQSSTPSIKQEKPRYLERIESTPSNLTCSNLRKSAEVNLVTKTYKTLTLVRGDSASLVDLTTYIESRGSQHLHSSSPTTPRERQRIFLDKKSKQDSK